MRPDDILNAIGEVDDTYIKKAHQKSFLKAFLVFAVIIIIGCAVAVGQLPDFYLQLRYNPDASVITGYAEPEALIHNKWTSAAYTAYAAGEAVSTTEFRLALDRNYSITHVENGVTTRIVGTDGNSSQHNDYLGSQHYTNLYISTLYSTDLLDRIDNVYINSETAYGVLNQQLNCIKLEYSERSDRVSRQTLLANGRTSEETVIGSRGYSYQNGRITGWKEWDAEYNLLAYAEYAYDGSVQTVSTYLADGTLTGIRVSKYSLGNLKWREYYDADGVLTGKEVYRYRVWELFFSLQGFISLVIILSLALTAGIALWDDRIQRGTRLIQGRTAASRAEMIRLTEEMEALRIQITQLSEQLKTEDHEGMKEEIAGLCEELVKMNERLDKLWNTQPGDM